MPEAIIHDKAAVLNYLLQCQVHEYLDVDGRPVGEGRSQAYARVETKFKSCPYAGSRYHHAKPMNVSAFQSILPKWQDTLAVLAGLSQRYQAYYQKPVSSFCDLALIAGMGVFLTDYLSLRRSRPVMSGQFPIVITGLYKVCLGFQQATFLAMMNDQFERSDARQSLPDAKGFYAYLEEQELLIGDDEVCGGSEEMISRAYEMMKGQVASTKMEELSELAALEIDWAAYDEFSFHTSNLFRKAILFGIVMQDFKLELHDADLPGDLCDRLNSFLNTSFSKLLNNQSGLAIEMARFTLKESSRSPEEWRKLNEAFFNEIGCRFANNANTSVLAEMLVREVNKSFDLSGYQSAAARAVQDPMSRYECLETATLHAFNDHLAHILNALDYAPVHDDLSAEDLFGLYGATLRHLPIIMRQERISIPPINNPKIL